MPECVVTLTANCGVLIECNGKTVACDALHDKRTKRFSSVEPELQSVLVKDERFKNIDVHINTHDHPDHYSKGLNSYVVENFPNTVMISPIKDFKGQIVLEGDRRYISKAGMTFDFKSLLHDGEDYKDLPNYGCIMNFGGFRVLVLGDCCICNPQLIDWLKHVEIDLALLNFPWITISRAREFLKEHIIAKHYLIYHLPFEKDDKKSYRLSAEKVLERDKTFKDIRLLYNQLQQEKIKF